MAEGCPEKLDAEFVKWILWDGCGGFGRKKRQAHAALARRYPGKVIILKNQKQLNRFIAALPVQP